MTDSLIECRKDDEEFLRQCLASFLVTKPEGVYVDNTIKYILDGLMGYSDTIVEDEE